MIEGFVGIADFCKQTIDLVLFTRFHYIIHCFASVVGARIAKSQDSGQN